VSHYGDKPKNFVELLKSIHDELINSLSDAFEPYSLEQVHSTIIGLEGYCHEGKIINYNYLKLRKETRYLNPIQLLKFLRSPNIPSIEIEIGGYLDSKDYKFLSQSLHPHYRSFSIQGNIAVAMGWPRTRTNILDDFRHSFNRINVLHKWHKKPSDVDNDFFFVLGRVNRKLLNEMQISNTEIKIRQLMAQSAPLIIEMTPSTLSLVCYSNYKLPRDSSVSYSIQDKNLVAEDLLRCYSTEVIL
jgi:hypothetical protein